MEQDLLVLGADPPLIPRFRSFGDPADQIGFRADRRAGGAGLACGHAGISEACGLAGASDAVAVVMAMWRPGYKRTLQLPGYPRFGSRLALRSRGREVPFNWP